MASAVQLTNARAGVSMDIPDGRGNILHLNPKETKVIYGEVEYFRKMMRQGVTGLVVKTVTGKLSHDVEAEASVDSEVEDVGMVTITNHRKIPMDLATGVDRVSVHIGPGSTSEPVLARASLIKQITGVSVRKVDAATPTTHVPKETTGSKRAKSARNAGPELKVSSEKGVPHTSEPPVASVADLRSQLGFPDTLAEFEARLPRIIWHDLRGYARQMGLKGKTRDEIVEAIKAKLYSKG